MNEEDHKITNTDTTQKKLDVGILSNELDNLPKKATKEIELFKIGAKSKIDDVQFSQSTKYLQSTFHSSQYLDAQATVNPVLGFQPQNYMSSFFYSQTSPYNMTNAPFVIDGYQTWCHNIVASTSRDSLLSQHRSKVSNLQNLYPTTGQPKVPKLVQQERANAFCLQETRSPEVLSSQERWNAFTSRRGPQERHLKETSGLKTPVIHMTQPPSSTSIEFNHNNVVTNYNRPSVIVMRQPNKSPTISQETQENFGHFSSYNKTNFSKMMQLPYEGHTWSINSQGNVVYRVSQFH